MKDRFKFRVWDKSLKKYMEFKEFKFMNVEFTFNPITKEAEIEYDKERYDVEQCTGLKDKNGKLIYEGDLIKSPNNSNLLEVIWEESSWHTKEYKPNGKNELILDSLVAFYGVEIVGNIHEKESK